LSAQLAAALADNALLIVAIAVLDAANAPGWMTPLLKFWFIVSFVAFAFVVGVFADAYPKARVMMAANLIKAGGCVLMLAGAPPLAAYAVVGFGAAVYSPAKYGVLVELLPASRLVAANAWLEGLTIGSVIFGTFAGGLLVGPEFAALVGEVTARSPAALVGALATVCTLYGAAAAINLHIPDTGQRHRPASRRPPALAHAFLRALRALLADRAARAALLVTSLLWGAGAALQFMVIDWSRERLQLPLDRAAMLPAFVALGVTLGALAAARWVPLGRALAVVPVGALLGPLLISVMWLDSLAAVCVLLGLIGVAAGLLIVPMNALLQHRGHALVNTGQAIAVQNFCENLSVMAALGLYATARGFDVPLSAIVLGLAFALSMALLRIHFISRSPRPAAAMAAAERPPQS
jgi:MFS family permease